MIELVTSEGVIVIYCYRRFIGIPRRMVEDGVMISNFFNSWYPAYFLVSAIIMIYLGIVSFKYRRNMVAKYFMVLMFLNAIQSLLSILEVTSENIGAMLWFRNLQQIPLFSYPIVLFFCVLEYIGKKSIVDQYKFLFFLPTISYFILIFTDGFHHLMRVNIDIIQFAGISKLSITSTTFSKFFINYGGVLLIISFFLLLLNIRKITTHSRIQNIMMLLVIGLIIGNEWLVSLLNIKYIDFKVVSYIPLGIVILIGIKNHKIFSIYPIAKDIIIENMKDGIIIFDNDYRIVDFNQSAELMVFDYYHVHLKEDNIASKEAIDYIKEFEKTNKGKFEFSYISNGQLKELDLNISPIFDKGKKRLGYLLVMHDVSEYKQLQRQLERSQQERMELLSNISHDLRNPLTSIIGFSNAILSGKASTKDTKYVQYIYDRSQLIKTLVSDLLELTKLETRTVKLECVKVKTKDYFIRLCKSFKAEIESTGKRFTYEISDGDTIIEIDLTRIEQVIDNLISNAMKHTKQGDTISIYVYQNDKMVRVEVVDSGVGILEEEHINIFTRYYTSKTTSTSHGLGLAICKEIIDIHNGEIGVKSESGKGSTFYFTVPIIHESAVEEEGHLNSMF